MVYVPDDNVPSAARTITSPLLAALNAADKPVYEVDPIVHTASAIAFVSLVPDTSLTTGKDPFVSAETLAEVILPNKDSTKVKIQIKVLLKLNLFFDIKNPIIIHTPLQICVNGNTLLTKDDLKNSSTNLKAP